MTQMNQQANDIPGFTRFGGYEVEPCDLKSAEIVVYPFCYEHAPSYGTGSRYGALHILNASEQLEALDDETFTNWCQMKIHTLPPLFPGENPEQAVREMKRVSQDILDLGKFLLCLGGDHAISMGPIMAAANKYPNIGVLQIDAHLDLRAEWNGSRYNHACVMRRAIEDAKLPIAQVGIRSISTEEYAYVQEKGLTPFYAKDIIDSDDEWMDRVVRALPEKIYMTIDLDGLDPSVIPGTGTPEPGGLSYRQLLRLIRVIGRTKKVVAADINELAKIEGTQVSEFTAAKIATKIFIHCAGNSVSKSE